ncbi:hypothetical protein [Deinococcus multiflagellatus]|uniref:Uncharacterized protein n=1 Tax=Deinococcus multiflagellatus TaxID=1656887 RepID=A0ABW1ZMS6_9DEIO
MGMKATLAGGCLGLGMTSLMGAIQQGSARQGVFAAGLLLAALLIWKKLSDRIVETVFWWLGIASLWLFCGLCIAMTLLGLVYAALSIREGDSVFWTALVIVALALPCALALGRGALQLRRPDTGKP